MLDVFGFTNTELGSAQAVYGIVAMIAYFPGGPLADRFSARNLLIASLLATAAGGLYMATIPSHGGAAVLFGFWGMTTILLFWAALIKATRDWGGAHQQGRAYGLLDGGRGLLAAILASSAVALFGYILGGSETATPDAKLHALRVLIFAYSLVTAAAAVLVWLVVPRSEARAEMPAQETNPLRDMLVVSKLPVLWLQAIIVICAYVGYKGVDNLALYAVEGYGLSDVRAAEIAAWSAWVRPLAAVGAGLLGDRIRSSRMIVIAFGVMLMSNLLFAGFRPVPSQTWLLIANILISCAAVFGLRGLYFALFAEGRVPASVTGAAVGLVSVIGYTPDVFVGVVGGWLLDRTPGVVGHQHYFAFLAAFAFVGLITAAAFGWVNRNNSASSPV